MVTYAASAVKYRELWVVVTYAASAVKYRELWVVVTLYAHSHMLLLQSTHAASAESYG